MINQVFNRIFFEQRLNMITVHNIQYTLKCEALMAWLKVVCEY